MSSALSAPAEVKHRGAFSLERSDKLSASRQTSKSPEHKDLYQSWITFSTLSPLTPDLITWLLCKASEHHPVPCVSV